MNDTNILVIGLCLLIVLGQFSSASPGGDRKDESGKEKKILPKDPLYINEMDIENLYEQWEEADDDKLPDDEQPQHKRRKPSLTKEQMDNPAFKDPEMLMRATKKGQTVMAFVIVKGDRTMQETEDLTQRWQVGLLNNHINCERFVVANNKSLFVFHDGSQAFEAIDYLTDQPELEEYSIDNRSWPGRHKAAKTEECAYDPNNPSDQPKDSCNTKPAGKTSNMLA